MERKTHRKMHFVAGKKPRPYISLENGQIQRSRKVASPHTDHRERDGSKRRNGFSQYNFNSLVVGGTTARDLASGKGLPGIVPRSWCLTVEGAR